MKSYLYLAATILCELLATTCIKYSEGFKRPLPSIACVLAYVVCYFCFSRAVTRLNLSVAYATWCGVGILLTTLISYLVFKEKLSPAGVCGILLIAAGSVIINLYGTQK